jgi:hypothetical protein
MGRGPVGPRVASRLWKVGLALAGVVAGHVVAYGLGIPDHAHRTHYLTATGHAYWPLAVAAAGSAGLVAAAVVVAARLRTRIEGEPPEPIVLRTLIPQLAALQTMIYLALEVVERLASNAPMATDLATSLLVRGVISQVVIACVAALLIAWLARLVERTGLAGGRPEWQPPLVLLPPIAPGLRASNIQAGSVGARAPPS